jgi:transposase
MTIGIDIGDKYCHLCVLDRDGEVIEQGRITTNPKAIRLRFEGMDKARIALETGAHSQWMSHLLKDFGHEVLVANSRRLRFIYKNDSKDDVTDSEHLARVARLDPKLLEPLEHRDESSQEDLVLLKARDALVGARTALVNMVRGQLKNFGVKPEKYSTESFHKKILEVLPDSLKPALMPVIETIAEHTRRIRRYERDVDELAKKRYPSTSILTQVNGVGTLTAVAFMAVLYEPYRFKKSRKVASYLGLRPKRDESGESNPQLPITKAGNVFMRRLLVGSANYILGPFGKDCDLRRWGLAIASRGGKNARKRAKVAVARKLSVLLHRLWVTGEEYHPFRGERGAMN